MFSKELVQNFQQRNIPVISLPNKDLAKDKLKELIALDASVGFCGSQTLVELGVIKELEDRGNKVFNPYLKGLSPQQSMAMRLQGAQADVYLTSVNAVSVTGTMVFLSAWGHRIAGIALAKKVFVVCGTNKIVPDLSSAMQRGRNISAVMNCRRLQWDTACLKDSQCHDQQCHLPEYKRMCCQTLIIEAEMDPQRLQLIIIEQDMGF